MGDDRSCGKALFEACNAMCDQSDEVLLLQESAVEGPLGKAAVRLVTSLREDSKGSALMDALAWLALVLEPWDLKDQTVLAAKRRIAEWLKERGLVEALLAHCCYWMGEWKGYFGDCGNIVIAALRDLCLLLPDSVPAAINASPLALLLIKQEAERAQAASSRCRYFRTYAALDLYLAIGGTFDNNPS